jgi:hypothetical protein
VIKKHNPELNPGLRPEFYMFYTVFPGKIMQLLVQKIERVEAPSSIKKLEDVCPYFWGKM